MKMKPSNFDRRDFMMLSAGAVTASLSLQSPQAESAACLKSSVMPPLLI